MSESMRKTEARTAERGRRRRERERKEKLWWTVPFVVVGLLVVIGAGLLIHGTIQATADVKGVNGPRLQVDRDKIDFGDVHLGKTVRASFKITNGGDGTLKLDVPQVATVVEGC